MNIIQVYTCEYRRNENAYSRRDSDPFYWALTQMIYFPKQPADFVVSSNSSESLVNFAAKL